MKFITATLCLLVLFAIGSPSLALGADPNQNATLVDTAPPLEVASAVHGRVAGQDAAMAKTKAPKEVVDKLKARQAKDAEKDMEAHEAMARALEHPGSVTFAVEFGDDPDRFSMALGEALRMAPPRAAVRGRVDGGVGEAPEPTSTVLIDDPGQATSPAAEMRAAGVDPAEWALSAEHEKMMDEIVAARQMARLKYVEPGTVRLHLAPGCRVLVHLPDGSVLTLPS